MQQLANSRLLKTPFETVLSSPIPTQIRYFKNQNLSFYQLPFEINHWKANDRTVGYKPKHETFDHNRIQRERKTQAILSPNSERDFSQNLWKLEEKFSRT